jgi:hypothetical protein
VERDRERKTEEKEEIKPYQYWDGKSLSRSGPVRKAQEPNKAERNRGSSREADQPKAAPKHADQVHIPLQFNFKSYNIHFLPTIDIISVPSNYSLFWCLNYRRHSFSFETHVAIIFNLELASLLSSTI